MHTSIHPRLRRDVRVIDTMIHMRCRALHGARRDLCDGCAELRAYARDRLLRCPFGAGKPTCSGCSLHCYKGDMRDEIRAVMRYAGPRMLFREPVMTLRYFADAFVLRRRHSR